MVTYHLPESDLDTTYLLSTKPFRESFSLVMIWHLRSPSSLRMTIWLMLVSLCFHAMFYVITALLSEKCSAGNQRHSLEMMSNLFNLIHLNKALKSYSELRCAPMEGLSSRKSNPFFKGVKILGFFSQIFKAARCGHPTTQSEFPSAQLFIIGHEFIIIILFLFLLP